jgi:serine/threonine-protein kinase 24/25/MST4
MMKRFECKILVKIGKCFCGAKSTLKQADIWSLGITALELANGQPPHVDLHPMRALFLIPNSDAPTLGGNFSKAFKEFVAVCLQKDPQSRPSAKELLRHKWIKSAKKNGNLLDIVKEHQKWLEEHKSDIDDKDDDEDEKFYRYFFKK